MKTIIKLLLIYLGFQLVGGLLAAPLMFWLGQTYTVATALVLGSLLMTWYLLKKDLITVNQYSWSIPSVKVLAWVIFLALGTYFAAVRLNEMLELPNWMEDQFEDLSYNVLGVLGIVVIGPVAEELLFRGAILGNLLRMKKLEHKHAVIISALIFGIIHFNPAQIFYAFLLGMVLARIYYQTGSLLLCIIVHVMLNGFSTLLTICYPEAQSFTEICKSHSLMWLLPVGLIMMLISLRYLKKIQTPPHWKESEDPEAVVIINEESKE